jgi:hypothetical protein
MTASRLHRGDTFDIEDARAAYRFAMARGILAAAGITPELVHGTGDPCAYPHKCVAWGETSPATCKTVWASWATYPMFEAAWHLADTAQTAQGRYWRTS